MNVGAVQSSPASSVSDVKVPESKLAMIPQQNTQDNTSINAGSREELENAVNKMNKTVEIFNREIKFSIHEKTHRIMVRVINKDTEEVISEMPPQLILDMVAQFREMVGMLVDKKA